MYKTKISTEINSNDWNSELKKSNYSTYLQTAEYLNINSNENTFPIFISVLDEKNAVVGQLGLLIIKTWAIFLMIILWNNWWPLKA